MEPNILNKIYGTQHFKYKKFIYINLFIINIVYYNK